MVEGGYVIPTLESDGPTVPSAPTEDHVRQSRHVPEATWSFTKKQVAEAILGLCYLLISLACGVWYVYTLQPSFVNDLWWAGFNLTGHEAFLVDLVNAVLSTTAATSLSIYAPSAMVQKTYASPVSYTNVPPTYARHVIFNELTSIEYAVPQLRLLSASWSMRVNVQHCWVDFERSFEVAHTTKRQQRCFEHYATNAGVYMEAILRNVVWADYLSIWGGDNAPFTVSIQLPLQETVRGRTFLSTMATVRSSTTVDDELAYWRTFGLTSFTAQWQNRWQAGVTESIELENALGMRQLVTLKNLPRGTGPWTSQNFFWIPLNDLWNGQGMGRSIIRGTLTYFGANVSVSMPAIDLEVFNGNTNASGNFVHQAALVRSHIGPFLSIDSVYVAVPTALATTYTAFQDALFRQLDAERLSTLTSISTTTLAPLPPAWKSASMFYGGNPMCTLHSGTLFPQQSFGFFDDCSKALPLQIPVTASASLFAVLATAEASPSVCAMATPTTDCLTSLSAASNLLQQLTFSSDITASVSKATAAVQDTRVGLMQFATLANGTWMLLQQPLLEASSFDVFGWILLFDWVAGSREVVSFQGDAGTVTLISDAYAPQLYSTGTQPLQTATKILFYLIVVTSMVLVFVGLVSFFYAGLVRLRFLGRNLFFFNRVVGAVWIGRPLAFLRGVTAILLLSSANVIFETHHGYSRFAASPRPWLASLIITGEATWVTYVINEALLIVTRDATKIYSPISSCLSWLILFCIELSSPVKVSATLARTCVGTNMDFAVSCTSGVVAVGSLTRVWTLIVIQAGVAVGSLVVGTIVHRRWFHRPARQCDDTLLVSGVSQLFLCTHATSVEEVYTIDHVACILSGLVPLRLRKQAYTFDLKLWLILVDDLSTSSFLKTFPCPSLAFQSHVPRRASTLSSLSRVTSSRLQSTLLKRASMLVPDIAKKARVAHVWMVVGLGYIIASIVGSISYLRVSEVNLSNDLFWATFNTTGAHAFIANWLNEQLVLGHTTMPNLALDKPSANAMKSFAASEALVSSSVSYGAYLQHEPLSDITATIVGLRAMDACQAPWIFAPYCFVDFKQVWSLANSARREVRCQSMLANGAVYLESVLRNINYDDFDACWGSSFEMAIASELRRSDAGKAWLHTSTAVKNKPTLSDEALYWRQYGIQHYKVQWQNYKRLGVLNSYAITNAYGIVYPLTLTSQNGTYRFGSQTSFKMYWAFANDLTAVADNSSRLAGRSLVRSSPDFAFANTTLGAVLVQNGTLASPLSAGFQLVQSLLGPYGSIDMVYVPVPASVRTLFALLVDVSRAPLSKNIKAQALYSDITTLDASYPVPGTWLAQNLVSFGGSPMCPPLVAGYAMSVGLVSVVSFDAICLRSSGVLSKTQPSRQQYILAALLSSLHLQPSGWDMSAVCAHEPTFASKCVKYLSQTLSYIDAFVLPLPATVASSLTSANADVRAMEIEFMIYTNVDATAPLSIQRLNLLAPTESDFAFFAWLYLYDWVLGNREVISFQGDVGNMTLLSDLATPLAQLTQGWQVTANVAQYLRAGVIYVTGVMIAVAFMAAMYMLTSRGHYEGLNMLELGRVGGVVWVGRPLLVLRSMTAICVLSTATLELQYSGYMSAFTTVRDPWYKTLLAANEVTWLVSIVNDIALIFTQEYSTSYVMVNGLVVWVVVAALTAFSPVNANTSIDLQCTLVQVDFQAICESGSIEIGQFQRLQLLIGIILVCNIVCFYAVKLNLKTKPTCHVTSLFLSSGAKYLYAHSNRVYNGVYYLDRASAALNGILSLRIGRTMYSLDMKNWRTFGLEIPLLSEVPRTHAMASAFDVAYPLLD
ncbi:hypothetical protein SDRG_02636 [Saprolegnia diclina VS20]|uniref:Transmembrane protein n=1 Tax=Saprolegnia diclina (strain VS20) TaxID=1156394 RepID=T0QZ75_SAPDV|nr:hypothetical protein SDRG_02636 [Saprolegnia diclina VS20]EQC39981.1 hypothetical protein SDRG_02636 [Saprolegnia diclina VS20]|eukprot:XP_008606455.1 hypothetical protein SDRG_02636 [Saprolegnia diclina VS20]